MNFAFTEEQLELREIARAFLAEVSSGEQVRAVMETERGQDPAVWKRIGAEMGWPSVAIPEVWGGLGLSDVELVALAETMGEAVLCSPFFASVGLAAPAILAAASEAQKAELLPGIAEGATHATLALAERGGRWDAEGIRATWRRDGDGYRLEGGKRHVVDGHLADLVLVAARAEGSRGEEGVALFAVRGDAEGLVRRALPTLDQTRRLAELELGGVRVEAEARLGGEDAGWPELDRALQHAAVVLAAEQVGGAQRCLELAVAHAKERVQFGRPIGSFQAIKHRCADMMVRAEAARSALYYAACVAAEEGAALPEAASMAKAVASEAYFANAAAALQVFGGVGFTWEYDVHLHLKRARSGMALLGEPAWHRERVARRMGL